jgi:hypothetical protein
LSADFDAEIREVVSTLSLEEALLPHRARERARWRGHHRGGDSHRGRSPTRSPSPATQPACRRPPVRWPLETRARGRDPDVERARAALAALISTSRSSRR